jgi:Tol biopolymer transport system component
LANAWSPDGKWIATGGRDSETGPWVTFIVYVESGKRQRVTSPPTNSAVDYPGSFSPDGNNLAFVRSTGVLGHDIYILPLAGGNPSGDPWRLTHFDTFIYGISWMPHSRELVFSSTGPGTGGRRSLWRILCSPGREPERIPGTDDGYYPAISKSLRTRLAYEKRDWDTNIWRTSLKNNSNPGDSAGVLISSSALERDPKFSPDGAKIAFTSDRSGSTEVWLAAGDGSNQVQLTSFAGSRTAGAPSWSPDGRQIVFDSLAGGNVDIFVIDLESRVPRQLTDDHVLNVRPSWSRDGRWIYFGSNRTGTNQVWRIPAEGISAQQVTQGGGCEAVEAPDGKTLYYTKTYADAPGIWRLPIGGGEETPVIETARTGHWAMADRGIYFIDFSAAPEAAPKPLKFFSFDTLKVERVCEIEKMRRSNEATFSVSRDGQWALWRQIDRNESNIMLIDNFR